jgi:hypothetical protein
VLGGGRALDELGDDGVEATKLDVGARPEARLDSLGEAARREAALGHPDRRLGVPVQEQLGLGLGVQALDARRGRRG